MFELMILILVSILDRIHGVFDDAARGALHLAGGSPGQLLARRWEGWGREGAVQERDTRFCILFILNLLNVDSR